ncbi:hypothetical protein QYE76_039421 [Lolium multiflorum]|uniref:Uncharacterized protein n=1 Tax=Lolium multiflorum TaxID=4521 RepID=A0AAD8WUG7_LOLMU|nr:hypothetical protein QYE76_039421 [Lolium multiflorum]
MDAEKGDALHAARWASSGLSSLTWGSASAPSLAAACASSSQPRVAAPPPPPPPGVARRRDPRRAAEVSPGTGDGVRGGWATVMMAGTGVGRKNYSDGGGDGHQRRAKKRRRLGRALPLATAEVCDATSHLITNGKLCALQPIFQIYRRRQVFAGPIVTLHVSEHNVLVREFLEEKGHGQVAGRIMIFMILSQ